MIKALGKRIVVSEVDLEVKKESLIILPKAKEQITAFVIAKGEEVDSNLEVGDVVYLLPDTGVPMDIFGSSYLSIMENQVLAAYKDK